MMNWRTSIWTIVLFPPAIIGSLGAALAFWFVGGAAAAAVALGTSLTCAAATGLIICRNEQKASAQLRRPELRGNSASEAGVFHGLLTEAVSLLERCEAEAQAASQSRTELEARTHVRQKKTRRLEAAINAHRDPVLITGARDELEHWNPAAANLFNSVASEAGGTAGTDPPKQPDVSRAPELQQLIQETRTRNAATDHRTAEFEVPIGGEMRPYRATATNVYGEDDIFLGLVAILSDIGEERESKTRHAEFVSSVSHELKTPMAGIKAFIEMLMDGDVTDPDEQQELYGFIEQQVDRLTRLVNNMLNLARIESGVIKIQRHDLELKDVLQKSLSVVQPVAQEKQIRVISELSELYLAVHVDPDLFSQAIINLLSNAAKYTPEGGEIRLRSRMDEENAVIEVHDTGMGIPEDSLPHIFDRFYRVPENNKAAKGTGLGLALVHYIVTGVHGGTIGVESTVNEGSCFTVRIPLGHRDTARKKQEPSLCMA